jgi:hypothetical protein
MSRRIEDMRDEQLHVSHVETADTASIASAHGST